MRQSFRNTFFLTSLLASTVLFVACESRGPGDIGSLNDVTIRNAGDPPVEKALAAKTNTENADIDPMIAEHAKAVKGAQANIDEQAAQDPDDTVVPGEPVAEPHAVAEVTGENTVETVDTTIEPNKEIVAAPAPSSSSSSPAEVGSHEAAIDDTADSDTVENAVSKDENTATADMTSAAMAGVAMSELHAMQGQPMREPEVILEQSDVVLGANGQKPLAKDDAPVEESAEVAEPSVQVYPKQENGDQEVLVDGAVASAGIAAQAERYIGKTGPVLNPDKDTIIAVQKALSDKGYYFGSADGATGTEMLNALYLYQSAHRMNASGLTYEVLDKLGVTVEGE